MNDALIVFRANIERVRSIHGLHADLSNRVTKILDLSDLLRTEIVLIVSALDHFIHEITRKGMIQIWRGDRPPTPAYLKFSVSLGVAAHLSNPIGAAALLESEIRARHGFLSFQTPDNVSDAIKIISSIPLWNRVAKSLGQEPKILKSELKLVIDRRNKIAHEADIDPSYPGQRWPISPVDTSGALSLVEKICETIYSLVA